MLCAFMMAGSVAVKRDVMVMDNGSRVILQRCSFYSRMPVLFPSCLKGSTCGRGCLYQYLRTFPVLNCSSSITVK